MRPGSSDTQPPRLELVEITKWFGSFVANEKVSLKLEPGTFHALLGVQIKGLEANRSQIYRAATFNAPSSRVNSVLARQTFW